MYKAYLDRIIELVKEMKDEQADAIEEAARLVADALLEGKKVFTFGSGHSQLLAKEIRGRAGGLYPIINITDPLWGRAERVEGVGEVLVERVPMDPGDVIFVISNSGRNPEPLEVAMEARERGLKVLTVTSLKHSKSVDSRHSSGKKLYELGDVVLDTGTPAGDATLSIEDVQPKVGAVSTVLGATILNAVMVEATKMIADAGEDPPVLLSANLDGSDEFNEKIKERYPRVSLMMGTFG